MDVIESRAHFDRTTGILVTVLIQENRYTVKVIVPAEIFTHVKNVRFSNKMYQLSLVVTEEVSKDIEIILKRGYKRGRYGLIKNNQAVLKIEEKGFTGKLVLNPKFYIREDERATLKNLSKAESMRNVAVRIVDEKPSESKYTAYKSTNISHPFQGGKVSPK